MEPVNRDASRELDIVADRLDTLARTLRRRASEIRAASSALDDAQPARLRPARHAFALAWNDALQLALDARALPELREALRARADLAWLDVDREPPDAQT